MKKSLWDRIRGIFIEEEIEDDGVEEKQQPVIIKTEDRTIKLVDQQKKEEPKSEAKKVEPKKVETKKVDSEKKETQKVEQKVIVNEKVVEEPKKEEPKKSSFLNVDEKTKEEKKAEKVMAREHYRPAQVISPIFGSSEVESYNIGSSHLEVDDEKSTVSVIGTVLSPMYGKDIVKVTVEDEVDEKVAKMTTKDFITKGTVVAETTEEVVEEEKVTTEVAESIIKMVESSKSNDEFNDAYENLRLFD